jgi:tyrosyl-tRNA synthetase
MAYLKFFTFLTREQIDDLDTAVAREPEKRKAQQVLAEQVTTLVHGAEEASRAQASSHVLFTASVSNVTAQTAADVADTLLGIADDVPSMSIAGVEFDGDGLSVVDMVSRAAGASKSEARRLVQQGGVSVNDRKISDANARLTRGDAIDGRVFLLRKGARQRFVIRLT